MDNVTVSPRHFTSPSSHQSQKVVCVCLAILACLFVQPLKVLSRTQIQPGPTHFTHIAPLLPATLYILAYTQINHHEPTLDTLWRVWCRPLSVISGCEHSWFNLGFLAEAVFWGIVKLMWACHFAEMANNVTHWTTALLLKLIALRAHYPTFFFCGGREGVTTLYNTVRTYLFLFLSCPLSTIDQYIHDASVQLRQWSAGSLHVCSPGFLCSLMDKPEAPHSPTAAACTQVLPAFSWTKEPTLAGVYTRIFEHKYGLAYLACAFFSYCYCEDSKLFGKKTDENCVKWKVCYSFFNIA